MIVEVSITRRARAPRSVFVEHFWEELADQTLEEVLSFLSLAELEEVLGPVDCWEEEEPEIYGA